MMRMGNILNNKAQSTLDYAIIMGLVVVALATMQTYVRRGIQAVIKVAADEMGRQEDSVEDAEKGTLAESTMNIIRTDTQRVRVFNGGSQRTDLNRITTSSGSTTYITFDDKD